MQKLVVDTNVLVSSFLGKSYPYRIIHDLVLMQKVQFCLSSEILAEYEATLCHPKFKKIKHFTEDALDLLVELKSISVFKNPSFRLHVLADPDDNKFLELALSANADYLVTGNSKHFPYGKFENTEIISPEKYWNTYWK